MRYATNLLLFLCLATTIQAQTFTPGSYKKPATTGPRTLNLDTGMLPVLTDKTGNSTPLKINAAANALTRYVSDITSLTQSAGLGTSIQVQDAHRGGNFMIVPAVLAGTPDGGVVFANSDGTRSIRLYTGPVIIKWWGAIPNDGLDDAMAINKAIAYAAKNKVLSQFITVYVPEDGEYLANTTINGTDIEGIIIQGGGNSEGGSTIVGNTNGICIDFSGSSKAQLRDITISVPNGLPTPSTVGVQFALSKDSPNQATAGPQKMGLNCGLFNVTIRMGDFVGINAGLGAIGLLNCRSEEFTLNAVRIVANTPMVFTTTNNLAIHTGYAYTVLSSYIPIQDDAIGSMGVISGEAINLKVWEHLTPAMLLNGVNTCKIHGYISRLNQSVPGSYETAIRVCQTTLNLKIDATIEGFGTALDNQNVIYNSDLNLTVANQTDPTVPVVKIDNLGGLLGTHLRLGFGNLPELNNGRMIIYTPPVGGGDEPTGAFIKNSTIDIPQLTENRQLISANLFKQSQNTWFNSDVPIYKNSGYAQMVLPVRTLGTTISGGSTTVVLAHFPISEKTTINASASGYYQAEVEGTIMLGDYNTGNGPSAAHFKGAVLRLQRGDGVWLPPSVSGNIDNQVSFNGSYLNLNTATLGMSITGNEGTITLTVNNTGAGATEGINWAGTVKLATNKKVNASILYP